MSISLIQDGGDAGMERKIISSDRDNIALLPVKFLTAAPSGCIVTNK